MLITYRSAMICLMMMAIINGASAVELGFSMSDGSQSIGVSEYYNVGLDASVEESISANPVSSAIGISKSVAGSGNAGIGQSLKSSAYSVDGQILITEASSYSIAGSVILNPCAISTQQALSSAGGTSQSLLEGIYGLEGVTQYAGVGQGSLISEQSLTFADGVSASQSVAASGTDPHAAMTVGALEFDPANGDLIGEGGFAALGANGLGAIQGQLVARSVKGQPLASTLVSAPVLAVSTLNTGFAALGVGNMMGNLYAGQIAGQGAIGMISVAQGSFVGQAAGFTERYVDTLPDCDLQALIDPAISLSVIGSGEMAAAGVAAGSVAADIPEAVFSGQGALMAIAATNDALIFGSLLAETDGEGSYAGGSDIFAGGDGLAIAAGAAGAIDADLQNGYIGGEAGLVGLGGIGVASMASSDFMEVEVGDSVYAEGYSMEARGGDVAAIVAGVVDAGLDIATGRAGAGAAFAGTGAGGNALARADYIGAFCDESKNEAEAAGISASGDLASAAAAGVLGGGIDLASPNIEAEGAIVGAGALGSGHVNALLLEAEMDGSGEWADGALVEAAGSDLAAIAAGVAGAGLDLTTGMAGASGAFAAAGAGGDALAQAGYIGASSDEFGTGAGVVEVTASGDSASAIAAGVGGGGIDLASLYLEAGGALAGAGAGGSGLVSALALGAGMDASGLGAEADSVIAIGEDVALIAAGVAGVDFDIAGGRLGAGGAIAGAGAGGNGLAWAQILYAEMNADGMYAKADSALAFGDSAAAIAAGAADVDINLNKLKIAGDAALAGVGAIGNGFAVASYVDAGLDQWGAFAGGEALSGSGDTAAVAAAGACKVDLNFNKNKYEALGSFVGVGAGENGLVDAGSVYAETWPSGSGLNPSQAWGYNLEASGDTAAVAMAGSGDIFLNLDNGKIWAYGALAGVGAGENGYVEADHLNTFVGDDLFAEGYGLYGEGDTAAVAAAGATAAEINLGKGKISADAALAGVGAGENGKVEADHLAAGLDQLGAFAGGEALSGSGDTAAVAAAGAGKVDLNFNKNKYEALGSFVGVGAGENGLVDAGSVYAETWPSGSGLNPSQAWGYNLEASGDTAAVAAAGSADIFLNLNKGKITAEGALAGVGAGEHGMVEASYLETYVGNSAGAYGEGLIGSGDTAAIAAAGAGTVGGKGISLDLTQGKVEASGALAGAGALNQAGVMVDQLGATIEDDMAYAGGSSFLALGGAAAVFAGAGDLGADLALMEVDASGALAFAAGGGALVGAAAASLLEAQTGPIIGANAEGIGAIGSDFALTGAGAGEIEWNPIEVEYAGSLAGAMAMGGGLTSADLLHAGTDGSLIEASATNAYALGDGLTAGAISVHSGDGAETGVTAELTLTSGQVSGDFYTMVEEDGGLNIEASADNFYAEGTGFAGGVSSYYEDSAGRLESDVVMITSEGIAQGSINGYVTTGSAMTGAGGSDLFLQGVNPEIYAQSWYGDASSPSDCAVVWINAGMGTFSNGEFQTDAVMKAKTKMVTSGGADFNIIAPGTAGSEAWSPSDGKLDFVPLPALSSGHADMSAKRKKDETAKAETNVAVVI